MFLSYASLIFASDIKKYFSEEERINILQATHNAINNRHKAYEAIIEDGIDTLGEIKIMHHDHSFALKRSNHFFKASTALLACTTAYLWLTRRK